MTKDSKPYLLVENSCYYELQHLVNLKVAEGYLPIGGLTILNMGSCRHYIQAMFKGDVT